MGTPVKSGSIFYRGKRIAMMQNVEYTINTGDTQEDTDGGPVNTDGVVKTEVSCDTLVPLAGVGVGVVQDAIEHQDVAITLGLFDGKIHELKAARARTIRFQGEASSGKQTGRFEWFAGKPAITG